MNCCQPTGIPDDATIHLFKLLGLIRIFTFILLAFCILQLFISIMSSIWMLLLCLALYMIRYTKNFRLAVICSVLFLMQFVVTISESGTIAAKNEIKNNAEAFFLFIFSIKIPLYLLIVYYTFLTYKELKALYLEGNGGAREFDMQNLSQNQSSFVPFTGQGMVVG